MSRRKKKKPKFNKDDNAPTQESTDDFNKACGTHFSFAEMKEIHNTAVDLLNNAPPRSRNIMSNEISNEEDAERLNMDIEELLDKWKQRGEGVQEVALALQRSSIMLFVGHGFTPKFLGGIVKLGAENTRRTINKVQQERDDDDQLTFCSWKDTEKFSAAAQ